MRLFSSATLGEVQGAIRDLEEAHRQEQKAREDGDRDLGGRVKVFEDEREARSKRREFWIVKMVPAVALSIAALGTLNAVFHWTG
jgi:hypothetical protein